MIYHSHSKITMKKVLFIVFLFYFMPPSWAQSTLPKKLNDSLWNVWSDTTNLEYDRFSALTKYTQEGYMFSQPDSAFYFAKILFDFAIHSDSNNLIASAKTTLGISHAVRGNFFEANNYFSSALEIYIALDDESSIMTCYEFLGNINYYLSNYQIALNYLLKNLAYAEKQNNFTRMASTLNTIGLVYTNLNEKENAISAFLRSLEMFTAAGDKRGVAVASNNLSGEFQSKSDFSKAEEFAKISLNLYRELKNKNGEAKALIQIARLYQAKFNFVNAIAYYNQALAIQIEIDDKMGVAATLNSLALCNINLKNYNYSIELYFQSLALLEEVGNKNGIAGCLSNLGGAYLYINELSLAEQNYTKCLAISKEISYSEGIVAALIGLSQISILSGDYKISIELLNSAKPDALLNSQQKDLRKLLYLSYLKIGNFKLAGENLSALLAIQNDILETNFFLLPESEKELFFQSFEDDFGSFYDFTLFFQTDFVTLTDSAYNLAIKSKGLTLKSSTALRSSVLNGEDSVLIDEYNQWIHLKKQLLDKSIINTEVTKLEQQANELEKELIKKSNAFSDFDKIKNLEWKQVQASLEPNEAAIEFVNFKSEIDTTNPIVYAALIVKPTSVHPDMVRLCTEDDLKKIIGTFQGNNLTYVTDVYGSRAKANKALYQKVWQPMEPFLDGVKNVYYSPSGLLNKISFAALSKDNNVFLCDNYNLEQKSSTGNLTFDNDVAFGELENFLLMGGVNYNITENAQQIWSYLPGSLQETEIINSFLTKKKFGVNYFKENNATEAIFKEKISSSSIVHIATHGFFFPDPEQVREEMKADEESVSDIKFRGTTNYANWSFVNNKNPLMRSGIVLANANSIWEREPLAEGEDGVLTAQEVSNLDLRNTKLVVLSACETGLGDIKGSEGVYGLQRAFKMAGVKYIIMSLWQVPDKETSEFMTLFYKNLIKLKDIPTAFQKTQKIMRSKYDPYYWGAFVLIE